MEIFRQLCQLILKRAEPQDIPYNLYAAVTCVAATLFLTYSNFLATPVLSRPLLYAVVAVSVQVLSLYFLLQMKSKQSRFVQTITASFGVSIIISAIWGIVLITKVFALLLPFILFWFLHISTIILRSAFETTTFLAVFLMLIVNFSGLVALTILFPEFLQEVQTMAEAIRAQAEAQQQ